MDPVERLVREIHDEFLRVDGDTSVKLAIGNKEEAEHGRPPRIAWIEEGGSLEMGPSQADGIEVPAAVLIQRPRMLVKCWGKSVERARELMFRTILACHRVGRAEAQFDREYECPAQTEGRHAEGGALMMFRVTLAIEIPIDTELTRKVVTIEGADLDEVTVNEEQVL
ncbi:MAG: hypothetical protein DIU78_009810 [Pseudomonadota bacterium]